MVEAAVDPELKAAAAELIQLLQAVAEQGMKLSSFAADFEATNELNTGLAAVNATSGTSGGATTGAGGAINQDKSPWEMSVSGRGATTLKAGSPKETTAILQNNPTQYRCGNC